MNQKNVSEFPQIYDRFILLDLVGSGGMGQVFRAVTLDEVNRVVVVKKIYEHYRTNSSYARMFRDEIKVLSLLNHPNIVHLYTYGSHGEFLEMEYVRGLSVHQILELIEKKSEKIPIEIIVYLCHEAAKALGHAHDLRDDTKSLPLEIVHRDISPHNLMLTYKGGVKVLDFGISKFSDKINITEVGLIKGKRHYISPEQNRGENVSAAADIYSLGAVLWRLLTGRPAFDSDNPEEYTQRVLQNKIPPPSQFNPLVPASLDQLCLSAMNMSAEHRLPSMQAFQDALLTISKEINKENSVVRRTSEWMQTEFKSQMLIDDENLRTLLIKAQTVSKEFVSNREKTVMLTEPKVEPVQPALPQTPSSNQKKWIYIGAAAAILISLMTIGYYFKQRPITELRDISGQNHEMNQADEQLSNLQLLVEQQSFAEAVSQLSQVPPQKRLASWQDVSLRAIMGQARLLMKTDSAQAFEFINEQEAKYVFLTDNENYRQLRKEIGLEWFDRCASQSLDCIDRIIPFIETTKDNGEFSFQLGVKATFHYFHFSALPLFRIAVEASENAKYCQHERLLSAVNVGLTHGPGSATRNLALEVKKKCGLP